MCLISDKIKFCSCVSDDIEKLKHYWIWYRFNEEKNLMIVGSTVLPGYLLDENYDQNKETLLNRLNQKDAFDSILDFKNNDHLEVAIESKNIHTDQAMFLFEYKNEQWHSVEYDPFYLMNNFDEEEFGKIKNALIRKNKTK